MESPSTTPPINTELQDFPELRRNAKEPKGVLQKNLKILLYLGAADDETTEFGLVGESAPPAGASSVTSD